VNEYALIQKFKQGDERTFEIIFKLHYKWAFFTITNAIGHDQNSDAESEVLRIMQNLFNRREKFNTLQEIKNFIFICCKNSARNFIKKKEKVLYHTDICENLLKDLEWHKYEPKDSDASIALYEAISKLKGMQKTVMQMMYINNYTPKQIAQALNIETQTVYVHHSRAIAKIIELINKK